MPGSNFDDDFDQVCMAFLAVDDGHWTLKQLTDLLNDFTDEQLGRFLEIGGHCVLPKLVNTASSAVKKLYAAFKLNEQSFCAQIAILEERSLNILNRITVSYQEFDIMVSRLAYRVNETLRATCTVDKTEKMISVLYKGEKVMMSREEPLAAVTQSSGHVQIIGMSHPVHASTPIKYVASHCNVVEITSCYTADDQTMEQNPPIWLYSSCRDSRTNQLNVLDAILLRDMVWRYCELNGLKRLIVNVHVDRLFKDDWTYKLEHLPLPIWQLIASHPELVRKETIYSLIKERYTRPSEYLCASLNDPYYVYTQDMIIPKEVADCFLR